jgi:hypothetical protein
MKEWQNASVGFVERGLKKREKRKFELGELIICSRSCGQSTSLISAIDISSFLLFSYLGKEHIHITGFCIIECHSLGLYDLANIHGSTKSPQFQVLIHVAHHAKVFVGKR